MIVLLVFLFSSFVNAQVDCSTVRCAAPPTSCIAGASVVKTGCCSSCQCGDVRPSTCPQMRCAFGNAKATLANNCCGSCCVVPDCAAPPAGCNYDGNAAIDPETGCKTGCGQLVCPNRCATVDCAVRQECPAGSTLVKADPATGRCCDSCSTPVICPVTSCAAPPAGCTYDTSSIVPDERGCKTGCGKLVCTSERCALVDCAQVNSCPAGQYLIKADPTTGRCCSSCQQCPISDCAAPPPNCRYDGVVSKDERGCPVGCGKLVCANNCATVDCAVRQECPAGSLLVKADPANGRCCDACQQCPISDCAAPPPNCRYDGVASKDERGCPVGCGNLVCTSERCALVDCAAVRECPAGSTLVKADPANGRCCDSCAKACPAFDCAAPPPNCRYVTEKDANGCDVSCGKQACTNNCSNVDCADVRDCPAGETLVKGECCSSCQKVAKCEEVKCPSLLARANCRAPLAVADATGKCATKCICTESVRLQIASTKGLDAVTQLIRGALMSGEVSVTKTRDGVYEVTVKGDTNASDGDNTGATFASDTKSRLSQLGDIMVSYVEETDTAARSSGVALTASLVATLISLVATV